MIIAEQQATEFIQNYTKIMVQINDLSRDKPKTELLEAIVSARSMYCADRSLLDLALRELEAKSVSIQQEVVAAVRGIEVKKLVYLKDTRSHSVFIDPSYTMAYGVLGLTNRLRDIMGGTGAFVETGILRFHGHYIADGIVSHVVWIGSNMRKELKEVFAELRTQGKYYKDFES
jgi:hypothetical protein